MKKIESQQKDLGDKVQSIEWNEVSHIENSCQQKRDVIILIMTATIVMEEDE